MEQRGITKVLFVCTGNTCRSPMAEAIARKIASDRNIGIQFQSAGVAAWEGGAISDHAGEVLQQYGIDASCHRVQLINEELVEWADIVLTMTEQHRQAVVGQYSDQQSKIYNLATYLYNRVENVLDPYGGSLQTYENCAKSLATMIEDLFDTLSATGKEEH